MDMKERGNDYSKSEAGNLRKTEEPDGDGSEMWDKLIW